MAIRKKSVVATALYTAFLVGCLWGPGRGRAEIADAGGRRVIRADEIRRSGVTRLGDVMLLFDAWAPTTMDGFTWQASPRGLDPFQTASWLVMVDGVRIDAGKFGVASLNTLPVHVSDIDSVEVISLPGLHHGEFTGGGLVHIHTRRAIAGYDIGIAASTGNETGDPGPWAYTYSAAPNVDRIGPRYAARASYGLEKAAAGASYVWDRNYPTDADVRERTFGIFTGSYPQITLAAGSGYLAARFFGGWHRVSFWSSRLEDFFFLKPYGREVPAVNRLAVGALAGSFSIGESVALDYRVSRTARGIGYRWNTLGLDFDWMERTWLGGVDVSFRNSPLRHRYSAGYERVEASTAYALTRPDYHLARFGAQWEWSPGGRLSYRAAAMGTQGEGGPTIDGTVGGRWRVNGSNRFDASVSYVERRPERDGRIWFWQGRGYGFLRDAGVEVTSEGPLGTLHRWTMDIRWATEPTSAVSGSLAGYYRDFSGLLLEEQVFQFDPVQHAFSGPVHLIPDRRGGVVGGEAIAEARPSSRFRSRTTYRYERTVSGDGLFRKAWDAVPRHILTQTVLYTPASGFSIWARFAWMNETEWHDYEDAGVQTAGVYRSTLDDVVTLDLALTKWFWHGRLRGSLDVRNLLGASPRYHPIGASFDTTLFAGIELDLEGGPSQRPTGEN